MLKRIINDIQRCLENECFIAALSLALTIPDVCGKAEYPSVGNTERYIKWYNEHIGVYEKPSDPYGSDMPYTSGEIIYNLRNSMLHQGTPSVDVSKVKEERCKVDKFVLAISSECDSGMSCVSYAGNNTIIHRSLTVNIVNLCKKICAVANGYYKENADKFNFFEYELEDERERINPFFA